MTQGNREAEVALAAQAGREKRYSLTPEPFADVAAWDAKTVALWDARLL